jgi:sterol 3beta-glucosyltransferase
MTGDRAEATVEMIIKALAGTKQRGVLYTAGRTPYQAEMPEAVFSVGSILHQWLFPQMAAVVHHGGAGTTAAALRAGVPSIIAPFMGDQPFWAQRLRGLRAAPRPNARRRLTAENLATAIDAVFAEPRIQARAAEIGERIRSEDGIARAVKVIEQFEMTSK